MEKLSGCEDFTENEQKFMQVALVEARKALSESEVPVGCIFVRDGAEIVAYGKNETNMTCDATRHAELVALESINDQGENLEVYVTIEPCIMCAAALAAVKVKQVTYGAPNEKFGGCGSILSLHEPTAISSGYICRSGLGATEAVSLLKEFYLSTNQKAPKPRQDNMAERLAKRLQREKLQKVPEEEELV